MKYRTVNIRNLRFIFMKRFHRESLQFIKCIEAINIGTKPNKTSSETRKAIYINNYCGWWKKTPTTAGRI